MGLVDVHGFQASKGLYTFVCSILELKLKLCTPITFIVKTCCGGVRRQNYKACIITVSYSWRSSRKLTSNLKKKNPFLHLHNSNTGGISHSFTITPSNTAAVNCLQSVDAICYSLSLSHKFIFTYYNAQEYPVMPRINSEILSIKHGHRKRIHCEGKKNCGLVFIWFVIHADSQLA